MKSLMMKFIHGMVFAVGALFIFGGLAFVGLKVLGGANFDYYVYKVKEKVGLAKEVEPFEEPKIVLKDFTKASRVEVSSNDEFRYVSNTEEFWEALNEANQKGNFIIYLIDGVYKINKTINIDAENITLMSLSGNPYQTVIKGTGMRGGMGNLIRVNNSHFKIDGVTLQDASYHLVQVAGELDVDFTVFKNIIFQDSYQQMLKVSYDINNRPQISGDYGIVENCIFLYTDGIAPNYYTGGVDALGAKSWQVSNSIFRDIASPKQNISQYAVHFWMNSADNIITNNIYINNDRAIGMGLGVEKSNMEYANKNGEISHNIIFHSDLSDPFADTGIAVEKSIGTKIYSNYIFLSHSYPRAIEYRFEETKEVQISNNYTNRNVSSRDQGEALLRNNDSISLEKMTVILTERLQQLSVKNLYAKTI
ncbi:right-handed parallel beta-helix repeat-containing protein [Opacimonas viscosa]|uniref:Right-handed parallel beta-helix repeat-containing protein n=1 Tax=Opacimonas viscosa TaxID=2961944 RepID=A0AA41X177_9ALTE|nr:right-handed parallel beta-helix repeat-containing protein [Opacimonas viscosa]MCP3428491.1 right-handed parallel beta-helix repeat-containing protein [Opacimonas viscosa]